MLRAAKNIWNNLKLSYAIAGKDIILLFHHVGDKPIYPKNFHTVTPGHFRQIITDFSKRWDFVDDEEFLRRRRQPGLRPAALLTFDDGYRDTLEETAPLLERQKVPFIFFVNASVIKGTVLWRDRIRELERRKMIPEFVDTAGLKGITTENFYSASKKPGTASSELIAAALEKFCLNRSIETDRSFYAGPGDIKKHLSNPFLKLGNHSSNHYLLSSLSREQQEAEIALGHRYLISEFGAEHVSSFFSVPFGGQDSFDQNTVSISSECGYKAMLLTESNQLYSARSSLQYDDIGIPAFRRLLPKGSFSLTHFR